MKHILIILLLVISNSVSYGQDLNKDLHKAVVAKDTIGVKKLLESGADANYRPKSGFFEMSLLIWAVQKQDYGNVKLLIEHKAEVDFKDAFKSTALMYAANTGNMDIVSYLISKGADPTATDDQGNSVLSAAKESKNKEVIELIKKLQKK